jgi:hypothetical protein
MTRAVLPPHRKELLRQAVCQHDPALGSRLDTLGSVALTEEEREALRKTVLQELLATGLDDADEPNERGLDLEAVVDDLGRL